MPSSLIFVKSASSM